MTLLTQNIHWKHKKINLVNSNSALLSLPFQISLHISMRYRFETQASMKLGLREVLLHPYLKKARTTLKITGVYKELNIRSKKCRKSYRSLQHWCLLHHKYNHLDQSNLVIFIVLVIV